MDEIIFNDKDLLEDYTKEDLDQAVLYILNNFCNKQKHRHEKEAIEVRYRLSQSSLAYYDDDPGYDPGYYYLGYFVKYSPQLKDRRDVAKFELGFWLSEYDTFAKLKKYVINYDIPNIVSHSRLLRDVAKKEKDNDFYNAPKGYSPDDHIIDIGTDLDKEEEGIIDLDLDIVDED